LYTRLAWVYDAIYNDTSSYTATAKFVTRQINKEKLTVLEPGCGTGRLTKALANLGHRMTGVELHDSMLEFARKRIVANFIRADFRKLDLDCEYDLAVLNTPTFTYMLTNEDAIKSLQVLNRALKSGGWLFLENFSAYYTLKHMQYYHRREVYKRQETKIIRLNWARLQYSKSIIYIWEPVYVIEKEERSKTEIHFDKVKLRAFFPDELFVLLMTCGFQPVKIFGKTAKQKYVKWNPNLPELVVLARKIQKIKSLSENWSICKHLAF
jgi:SAM-dependent methyltransferase